MFIFIVCFFLVIVFFFCLYYIIMFFFFFFSSRRRHTRCLSDWSSDVCSSDLSPSCTSLGEDEANFLRPVDVHDGDEDEATHRQAVERDHRLAPVRQLERDEIGRASCRERGRSRWGPDQEKQKKREISRDLI